MSEQDLKNLLLKIDSKNLSNIIKVCFYMGLRISEIVNCKPAWVVKNNFLRIGDLKSWQLPDEFHPKSQKEFDLPIAIPTEVKSIFNPYFNDYGHKRIFGYKSTSTLRQHLKPCFEHLSETFFSNFTPHHLRHSCISYWLNERRVPIQEVQRLARHARMETTLRYYHPNDETHLKTFRQRNYEQN